MNSLLPSGTSIYYPIPKNQSSPTAPQLLAAVNTAVQNAIAGTIPAQYSGISVASLASQLLANPPAITTQSQLVDQIAKTVIASNSNVVSNLNTVITTLAATYPSTFSTFSQPIFTEAAANAGTATQISQLALTATNAVSSNSQAVTAISGQAFNTIATDTAVLSSAQIQSALLSTITAQLGSAQINGSLASISGVAASMTNGTVVAAVSTSPTTAMSTILSTAVNALPAADKASGVLGNTSVGAIAVGALVSAPNAAVVNEIQQDLASANAATAAYTNYVVNGYNNSSSTTIYDNYLASNPNSADAIVAGATIKGLLTPAQLITGALDGTGATLQASTATVQNIVASAVSADLTRTVSGATDDAGAIAAAAVVAIGSPTTANLSSIAAGAVGAARVADAGPITTMILTNSSASAANLQAVVGSAVTAAYVNGNQGAGVAAIVYSAEVAGTTTSPTTAVTYAINSMKAAGATNTYVAAAAALAGYGGAPGSATQTALTNIVNAALAADGGASGSASYNAITEAETILNGIRPVAGNTGFAVQSSSVITTLNTLGTITAPSSVLAAVYTASLADPNETSALLAAAISKSSTVVPSAQLLTAAINASPSNQAALTIVNTVATHIETNILNNNNNDITNFVGYEVAQNLNYVKDIASAAVVVDPNQSNYVALTVAANNPLKAYMAIPSIFAYSQITTKANANGGGAGSHLGEPTNTSALIDMASGAAALSAGYTIGIMQTANSPTMNTTAVQTALNSGITNAVLAAGSQWKGANLASSTGVNSTASTSSPAVGAAGVITGYISQVITPTDTTNLGQNDTTITTAMIDASLKAVIAGGGGTYALQMAQAAGQAFGYITKEYGGTNLTSAQITSVATEIGSDLAGGAYTTAALINAATFGVNQGQALISGAGASGISQSYTTTSVYYGQHSNSQAPTAAPVTNIFNL